MRRPTPLLSTILSLPMLLAPACVAQPATLPADAATAPATQPLPPTAASDGDSMTTDQLLDAMEQAGLQLRTLRATVEMKSQNSVFGGDPEAQRGAVWIERLPDGDTRGRVRFDERIKGRTKFDEHKEYLLAGDWMIERDYGQPNQPETRKETHRQVRRAGEKSDLLKLGEGPFPLPIGQPRERVREEFEVERLPDDAKHPGRIVLELRPRPGTRLASRYESVTLWVDPADALPRVVETVDADGTLVNTTTLSDVQTNTNVTAADFQLEPIDEKNWQIVRVPLE